MFLEGIFIEIEPRLINLRLLWLVADSPSISFYSSLIQLYFLNEVVVSSPETGLTLYPLWDTFHKHGRLKDFSPKLDLSKKDLPFNSPFYFSDIVFFSASWWEKKRSFPVMLSMTYIGYYYIVIYYFIVRRSTYSLTQKSPIW